MTFWQRLLSIFRPTKKKAKGAGVAALVMAAAIPVVQKWEGLRTSPYHDVVGVLTVCYGETEGAEMREYAPAECEAMLQERLMRDYYRPVAACIDGFQSAPVPVQAAVTSWAYNVGVGAACGSTLARKLSAGDLVGACNELPRWNRAGGRVIQGLINRRADERELCLEGAN